MAMKDRTPLTGQQQKGSSKETASRLVKMELPPPGEDEVSPFLTGEGELIPGIATPESHDQGNQDSSSQGTNAPEKSEK